MNAFQKQPSEIIPIQMDFSNTLQNTETISTSTVVAYDNTGAVVTSTIINNTSVVDNICKAIVKSGTAGKRYKITFTITTSESNTYEEDVFMQVDEY